MVFDISNDGILGARGVRTYGSYVDSSAIVCLGVDGKERWQVSYKDKLPTFPYQHDVRWMGHDVRIETRSWTYEPEWTVFSGRSGSRLATIRLPEGRRLAGWNGDIAFVTTGASKTTIEAYPVSAPR